ncbi:MAG: DUF5682 family protein, partial [Oscillospiraceae bacterium]|nr:DUF5682 family protein [Oscillospiraceae bacterium]
PAASFHLLRLLDSKKPQCVLIEGPSDANGIIRELAANGVVPPVAILSYTTAQPVDSVLYPFAEYSPEYQAVVWAVRNGAEVRFIDLPTGATLYNKRAKSENSDDLNDSDESEDVKSPDILDESEKSDDLDESEKNRDGKSEYYGFVSDLYDKVAQIGGGIDYDDYWEREFEHNLNDGVYLNTVKRHSSELRQIIEPRERELYPKSHQINEMREQFMKSQIAAASREYGEIVVVTGAYHSQAIEIGENDNITSDFEPQSREVKLTLMPYTFYRLSARSGYGAGNKAPWYFQTMWEHIRSGDSEKLHELPYTYMSGICRTLREDGGNASTASVIESVRLATALASMRGGIMPSLRDLHDAVTNTVGEGDSATVVKAFAKHDVGVGFGALPEGVSQTPIQDDINRELKRLKIEKYKSTVAQNITLDLRENTKSKSVESAFIELNRSTFFNRLHFLGIMFARPLRNNQQDASWREIWELQWSPEVEIKAVETALKGETVEIAAAHFLTDSLQSCTSISQVAHLIHTAYKCDLPDCFGESVTALQALAAEVESFDETARAAWELFEVIRYGDLRRTDTTPLSPLLRELFFHASLLLNNSAGCDDKAAKSVMSAIGIMHMISQQYEDVDDSDWLDELTALAFRDDKNAILSGLSFAILLERGLVDDERCSTEVSRRLSPGIPPDVGAGWFEGVSGRNRYSLLSRIEIWRALDDYISQLDEDEFKRSLVFLRRAFADFAPRERNSIAELLGGIWQLDSGDTSIKLQSELTEEEVGVLDELNDFDFDF